MSRAKPWQRGTHWRLQADRGRGNETSLRVYSEGAYTLDEITVGEWLHIEAMGDGVYHVQVGDLVLCATEQRDGSARVVIVEGEALTRADVPEGARAMKFGGRRR